MPGREPVDDGARFTGRSGRWTDSRWRSLLDPILLVAVAGSFWWVAGVPGVAVGALLAVSWVALPNVAVVAVGWIALGAVVGPDTPLTAALVPGLALGSLLLTTSITTAPLRDAVTVVVAWGLLAALGAGVYASTDRVWSTGLALLLAGVIAVVSMDLIALSRFGGGRNE